jgi:aquaporin Z
MRSDLERHGVWQHLPEYFIEGAALGAFMVSASLVSLLLEHPGSPVRQLLPFAPARRALAGIAMGLTLIAIVYSKPGRRSGAHLNPVVTLTFLRLGKVTTADAAGYITGQMLGCTLTMLLAAMVAGPWLADPAVNFVRTVPGSFGSAAAFAAEVVISFGMMLLVLGFTNSRWRAATGVAAGCLVALYIAVESPISGMSMNPARSLGPAVAAGVIDGLWIYLVAPAIGMFAAAEVYVRRRGRAAVLCAKLHHDARVPCPFICGYARAEPATAAGSPAGSSTAVALH